MLVQLRHFLDLAVITDRLTSLIEAPPNRVAERAALRERIDTLDRELERAADALFAGTFVPQVIKKGIEQRETELRDLQAKLEHLEGLTLGALPDFTTDAGRKAWAEAVRPLLADLRATLEANPPLARQRLREVLHGPIVVTPRPDNGELFFDLQGVSSFEAVRVSLEDGHVAGPTTVTRQVTGRVQRGQLAGPGVWCPRGDSNTRHAV